MTSSTRTRQQILDDLAEVIEKRRVCADDIRQYVDTFCDPQDRPAVDWTSFRESELDDLDEQIDRLGFELADLLDGAA